MTREINRAESWESVYEAFQQVNFTAFDYNSVKQNLIDYIKLYFNESFNDYIESSEIISIIEAFAYVTELLAYRIDVNAHENFILTAERKQSILRLAKLVSYSASRNIPARGLVKLQSVLTTEIVTDSRGTNLANTVIRWNDQNNPNWREQFFLVINKILQQDFGTVSPGDRVQVDDVLFELYSLDNQQITNGVVQYNVSVAGESYPMELVPSALNDSGPYERRPTTNSTFSLLYGNDGLGDSSNTTGFFCFTKQGTLEKTLREYDGITSNQTTDIEVDNINETDVWVNQIDPDTQEIIETQIVDFLNRDLGIQGEWEQVDIENGQNIVFNTNLRRNKYEIESLEDDQIRLIFGDGEFADIPSGTFEIWYRTSANQDLVIPQNSVSNQTASFTYIDNNQSAQTFTFTFSLINSLTNASASEDIEHIRRQAPSVYYTQDRMVNGRDYNTFPLQDPTILKLRTVNRTFAGDSKYIAWHDPSGRYEDVRIFGKDLITFFRTDEILVQGNPSTQATLEFIVNTVEPLLSQVGLTVFHVQNNLALPSRELSVTERADLLDRIEDAEALLGPLYPIYLEYYDTGSTWEWRIWDLSQSADLNYPSRDRVSIVIERTATTWDVFYKDARIIVESPTTQFWLNNSNQRTITTDTLNSTFDQIILLQANINRDRDGVLDEEIRFNIIGNERSTILPNSGLPKITQLNVLTEDGNNDSIPDNLNLANFFNRQYEFEVTTNPEVVTLPFTYVNGYDELEVYNGTTPVTWTSAAAVGDETNQVTVNDGSLILPVTLTFVKNDFVYYQRATINDEYEYVPETLEIKRAWYLDGGSTTDNSVKTLYQRYTGRDNLNFAWFHSTPRLNLIDPAPSNINDMIVITKGYYNEFQSWLRDEIVEPALPTSLQLRTDYQQLLNNKMLSDEVILHPGKFKLVFGGKAESEMQAKIVVVRSSNGSITNNEVKIRMVTAIQQFFNIDYWEFGETFYFSELSAVLHSILPSEVDSVSLVPLLSSNKFGDLQQINVREDEILQPDISVDDIEIVDFLNRENIRQCSD